MSSSFRSRMLNNLTTREMIQMLFHEIRAAVILCDSIRKCSAFGSCKYFEELNRVTQNTLDPPPSK